MSDSIFNNELFEAFSNASANVFIYVCDMVSNKSRWSQRAVEYFDLPGEYMDDAANIWLEKIHPEDRKLYLEDIGAVFSGVSKQHSCQYRAKNKFGDYVWLECKGSVIQNKNGEPSVFAGLMTRLDSQNKYDTLTHLLSGYEIQNYDFENKSGSLMLFGIDDFRKINNTKGYSYGNRVLVEFADCLQRYRWESDIVCRMDGDEFLILSPGRKKPDMVRLFQRIYSHCIGEEEPATFTYFTVSAGVVEFPEDGSTWDVLISNMEHCLEYAKRNGKEAIVPFSQKIADIHNRTNIVHEALRKSMRNGFKGFELYFQPLIDAQSGRINGCEALLRWRTEEIQDSTPYEFIRILEDSGEIREVGDWVMDQVLLHAKKWQEQYSDFHISFNVSYLQMTDGTFVDRLIERAEEYGVNPQGIMVELTESFHAENKESLNRDFERLQKKGFKIAMDDFGTQYASFGLLRDVEMDVLKIDQSFVRGLVKENSEVDMAIVESVVSMCNKLSIETVAEGIETEEIRDIVNSFQVSYLQGYLYSRPVPEKEFEQLLGGE